MGEDQQKKGKEKATPPRRARSLQSGQTPDGQVHALDIFVGTHGHGLLDQVVCATRRVYSHHNSVLALHVQPSPPEGAAIVIVIEQIVRLDVGDRRHGMMATIMSLFPYEASVLPEPTRCCRLRLLQQRAQRRVAATGKLGDQEHLVVRQHGWIEREAPFVVELRHVRRRRLWQARPLPGGGVHHGFVEQEQAVAVTAQVDVEHALVVGSEEAVEVAADRGARPGPGEEGREAGAGDQEEDAPQRERQEVRAQQTAAVDDGAPGSADAAGQGEVARRQAAENVRQEVFGQVVAHLRWAN